MDTVKSTDNQGRVIREAIRKIALGRSLERVAMSPGGMSGIGTARMVHGYVAKIHSDPNDEEFKEYGGTVDVGEFPDETASSEPLCLHRQLFTCGCYSTSCAHGNKCRGVGNRGTGY